MALRSSLILFLLLLASGSPAVAEGTDDLALDARRLELSRARAEVARLQGVQAVLRAELRQLSAEIEQYKQQGGRGGLEERLRKNQELSYQMSSLARELVTAEARAELARVTLSRALSSGLEVVQERWETTTDRTARQAMATQMRALRSERETLREQLEAPEPMGVLAERQTLDDPRELMEQADALRDAEDKVRQRLQQLDLRIAEARQERELDRRMGQFLGEEPSPPAAQAEVPERRLKAPPVSTSAATPLADTAVESGGETGRPIAIPVSAPGSNPPAQVPELADYSNLRLLEEQRTELKATADQLRARATEYELRAHQLK